MTRRRQIFLYTSFTLFCLAAGMVLTFPWSVLGRRLEAEAARQGVTLVINEIGPALPVGLRLARVIVEKPGEDGKRGTPIHIERLRVTPALLRVLTFRPALSFELDALDGRASGLVHASRKKPGLEAKLSGLDLGDGSLAKLTGLEIAGVLDGEVRLELDPAGMVKNGQITAQVAGGAIKKGKVAGFDLPGIDLGAPEVNITIEDGQASIQKLGTRSGDVEVEVTGNVTLRPRFEQSQIKGSARILLTDAWLNRNPTVKTLLGFAGSLKKPDGALEIPLNGTLARPANLAIPGMGR